MAASDLAPPGEMVPPAQLRIPRAREVARYLKSEMVPHMDLVECRQVAGTGEEAVVFEVATEVPQRPAHDIRRRERIALTFGAADEAMPVAYALRADFPWVPHVNLVGTPGPRQLCLDDQPWSEVRLRLTGARLLERVRDWLALTARGELHADDQALEPFIMGFATPVVLPFDSRALPLDGGPLFLRIARSDAGLSRSVLHAIETDATFAGDGGNPAVAMVLHAPPRRHGLVRFQPVTLADLHAFLVEAGVDLLGELRARLREPRPWHGRKVLDALLLLLVLLPKTRDDDGTIEETETWAFLCGGTVADIGMALGVWTIRRHIPQLLDRPPPTARDERVGLELLNPIAAFSRDLAARYNGLLRRDGLRITAVGMGALGSQIFVNLLRAGWGEWTTIDSDYLLPHNLARHALPGPSVGTPKASALARLVNATIAGAPIARSIVADVLQPGVAAGEIRVAWGAADVILDLSASVAVARHLASDVVAPARRLSLFLNPTGTDLVLLAEDGARAIPLDLLEQQYYRLLAETSALADHLRGTEGRIRYARSCRDVSAVIPQELVALHAAIGSRAIRAAVATEEATIAIWRADPSDLTVARLTGQPTPLVELRAGGWTLRTDRGLLEKIGRAREERLPNETGGVLLGAFDVQRRVAYVVDTLPSPPDSTEWPTLYIRGRQGLQDEVVRVRRATGEMLEYVGEWHAHPRGHGVTPSADDRTVLAWLVETMGREGLPAVMLIAGDDKQWGWHLEHAS